MKPAFDHFSTPYAIGACLPTYLVSKEARPHFCESFVYFVCFYSHGYYNTLFKLTREKSTSVD